MPTLDVVQAADVLKVDKKRVEELIHQCAIPAARIGRKYVMMEKDVLDYLEKQIVAQTAERMRRPTITDSRGRTRASSGSA